MEPRVGWGLGLGGTEGENRRHLSGEKHSTLHVVALPAEYVRVMLLCAQKREISMSIIRRKKRKKFTVIKRKIK